MNCQFKNEMGMCFFCKKVCVLREEGISDCKYFKRQFPGDKKTLVYKVKKALEKSIPRRDLFRSNPSLDIEKLVRIKYSVYDNVKFIVEEFHPYTIEYKAKKKIDSSLFLNGGKSPVDTIYGNLYEHKTIEIIERHDENKEILVIENGLKYLCLIDVDLDVFFMGLGKKKKDYDYFTRHIKEVKQI